MGCYKLKYYENETAIGEKWKIFVDGIEKTVSSQIFCKDYYAGGSLMPGRNFNSNSYRFSYQGSEMDNEITGQTGSHITTFFRENDTRILRWWSVDPKSSEMPWESPYMSMGGNPILYNDPLGDIIWIGRKKNRREPIATPSSNVARHKKTGSTYNNKNLEYSNQRQINRVERINTRRTNRNLRVDAHNARIQQKIDLFKVGGGLNSSVDVNKLGFLKTGRGSLYSAKARTIRTASRRLGLYTVTVDESLTESVGLKMDKKSLFSRIRIGRTVMNNPNNETLKSLIVTDLAIKTGKNKKIAATKFFPYGDYKVDNIQVVGFNLRIDYILSTMNGDDKTHREEKSLIR